MFSLMTKDICVFPGELGYCYAQYEISLYEKVQKCSNLALMKIKNFKRVD